MLKNYLSLTFHLVLLLFFNFDVVWQLKGFEVVRAVHLEAVPFDVERDLLTPTYKKKRAPLLKYYQVNNNV